MSNCIIAGGVESMSMIPMGGYKPTPDYKTVNHDSAILYRLDTRTGEIVRIKKSNIPKVDLYKK